MKKGSVLTESDVLKQLNIPNFRYMTKDKTMTLASLLPFMEKETAQKALEQFPHFANATKELVNGFRETANMVCRSNDESMKNYYSIVNGICSKLLIKLDKDNLSTDEKREILDTLLILERNASAKDTENKRFNLWMLLGTGAMTIGGLFLLFVSLGSRARIQSGSNA